MFRKNSQSIKHLHRQYKEMEREVSSQSLDLGAPSPLILGLAGLAFFLTLCFRKEALAIIEQILELDLTLSLSDIWTLTGPAVLVYVLGQLGLSAYLFWLEEQAPYLD